MGGGRGHQKIEIIGAGLTCSASKEEAFSRIGGHTTDESGTKKKRTGRKRKGTSSSSQKPMFCGRKGAVSFVKKQRVKKKQSAAIKDVDEGEERNASR